MRPDAWKLYCEAFRALFPSPTVKPDDVVSPAALQAMLERLGPPLGAGAQCTSCGFRYWEHNGHIIPCPRCALEEHKSAVRDMSALLSEAEKRNDALRFIRVLRELVVLKDMHDRIESRGNGISAQEAKALNREYRKRRPLAWQRAREVLAAAPGAPRPAVERKDDGTHPDWTPWTLGELLTDLDSGDYLYLTPTMCAALARMLRASLPSAGGEIAHLSMELERVRAERDYWKASYESPPSPVAAPAWIPVSERRPDHGDNVLFVTGRNPTYIWIGWRDELSEGSEKWRDHFDDNVIANAGDVTHWMPLPEAPRPHVEETKP